MTDAEGAGKILFVDDDASLRAAVSVMLARDGHTVDVAGGGAQALTMFDAAHYDLVVQDVRMPGLDGLELLARLRELDARTPVVVMTAFPNWEVAMNAMRLGAFDYMKKPFDNDALRALVRRAIAYGRASAAGGDGDARARARMIGGSPALKEITDVVRRVARTDSTVLVEGESGTGKELVASLLHAQSHRRGGPFVAVNCGGFSETLLESELFGHVRGAFTGAVADKRGLLELADGGTFFFDEIGETSLSTQVRLLRVLETKTFFPVGGETPRRADVRFVAATNRDLAGMAEAGTFRRDLYYRLNVIPVRVPPLRDRREDVPLLAGHFLSLYAERFHKTLTGFEPEAMDAMLAYDWPGNIRELQNAVQRAVSLAEGELVVFADLFPRWTGAHARTRAAGDDSAVSAGEGAPALPPLQERFDLEETLARIEASYIDEALGKTGDNLTRAADLLGITFRSIRYKVKKLQSFMRKSY